MGTGYENKTIQKIYLTPVADDAGVRQPLAGKLTITIPQSNERTFTSTVQQDGETYISLASKNGSLDSKADYYICVPALTLEKGYELHFVTTDNQVSRKRYSKAVTFSPNRITTINATLSSFKTSLLKNVELINSAKVHGVPTAFAKNTDGTVDVYKANNYELLNKTTSIESNNNPNFTSLDELPHYANIKEFRVNGAQNLVGKADLTSNKKLESIELVNSGLTEVDATNLSNVVSMSVKQWSGKQSVTSIKTTGMTALQSLDAYMTRVADIDLSTNIQLKTLNLARTLVQKVDLDNNPALESIDIYQARLTELKTDKNPVLKSINATGNGQLKSVNLANNTKLTHLDVSRCGLIGKVDLSKNLDLVSVNFASNGLMKEVDVTSNTKLTNLTCSNTHLTSLDLSRNTLLQTLNCSNNRDLKELVLTNNKKLATLQAFVTGISTIDLSHNLELSTLEIAQNHISNLDISMLGKLTKNISVGNQAGITLKLTLTQAQKNAIDFNADNNRRIDVVVK